MTNHESARHVGDATYPPVQLSALFNRKFASTIPILVVVAACLLCPHVASVALAGDTQLELSVELPQDTRTGTLIWGLTRQDEELARGKYLLDGSAGQGDTPVTVTAILDTPVQKGKGAITAHFCINLDNYDSYVPSFGDYYQAVAVTFSDQGITATARNADWQIQQARRPESAVVIHYHRLEGDYKGVGLWTWDEQLEQMPKNQEIRPVGRDEFGVVFQLDADLYGGPNDRVGLLPRRFSDWQHKDGDDRYWSPKLGSEIYLVENASDIFTEVPDVSPKVVSVAVDAVHHLTIRFTHRLPTADWTKDKFRITSDDGTTLTVKEVYPFKHRGDQCSIYSIETVEPLEFTDHTYTLHIEGFGKRDARIGHVLHASDRFYDPEAVLGTTYTPENTTFRVFAPTASAVKVVVAGGPRSRAGTIEADMLRNDKGVWRAVVEGDLQDKWYAFKLSGIGFAPNHEIGDIYATCTQSRYTRSLIVDLDKTDPEGFDNYKYDGPTSPADAVIYEMHVRDFTIAANSGVEQKGKYLGLTESGTHLPGDPSIKTCLDHIVELGVTHVQIMPIQDFDNREDGTDTYNWGYMPVHFNSPDGVYASKPFGPEKIAEFKRAVDAFHKRGIAVIMDVVYNHTASRAPFSKLVPEYYFRMTEGGRLSNGSGCGNEFKSENPMARKFIIDSVKYWVNEYKVDGYRFDLMGLIDLETMKQLKAELAKIHPGVLVYGEPWTGGSTPLSPITDKHQVAGTGVGAFNDAFRDAIKGGRDGGGPGYIQCGDNPIGVLDGLRGAIGNWAADPIDSINYFEAHDNLTSWDKLLQSVPHESDEVRKRMAKLAALILFSSQGAVFMQCGQEFCRGKGGSHNSYNLPDEVNQIDWSLKKTHMDLVDYYRGLIAMRKAHSAFRLRTRADVESRVTFEKPPHDRALVYSLNGANLEGEPNERVLVLLNGHTQPVTFNLPEGGEWAIIVDGERAGTEPLAQASGHIELPPNTGMVLLR